MQRTKKAICLLLSVLLALSCFTCLASVTAFAADGDTSILYDDVDGDGALTVQDDTHIQRYLTEFIDKFPAEDASEEDTLIVAGSETEIFGTGWDGTNEAHTTQFSSSPSRTAQSGSATRPAHSSKSALTSSTCGSMRTVT